MVELAYLNQLVHGFVDEQWRKRGLNFWEEICERWSLGLGHYHSGIRGTKQTARNNKETVPLLELAELVPEALCSGVGVQVSLLHGAAPLNTKEKAEEDIASSFRVQDCEFIMEPVLPGRLSARQVVFRVRCGFLVASNKYSVRGRSSVRN